jgi:hypothetical protein
MITTNYNYNYCIIMELKTDKFQMVDGTPFVMKGKFTTPTFPQSIIEWSMS